MDGDKISANAADAVKALQMAGVLSARSGNLFEPQGTATRAEASAVLHRLVELRVNASTAQGWRMNDSGKWMYYQGGRAATGTRDIAGKPYTFNEFGELGTVPDNKKYLLHKVKKDEYFIAISKLYGCTPEELMALNGLHMGDVIHPGDMLKVPQK